MQCFLFTLLLHTNAVSNLAPDAHARTTATDDGIHDLVVCGVVGVQLTGMGLRICAQMVVRFL